MAPNAVYQDKIHSPNVPKNEKKSPRVVKRVGEQNEQVQGFLKMRNEVKQRLKNL